MATIDQVFSADARATVPAIALLADETTVADLLNVVSPYPAIYCYECGEMLRTVEGKDLAEIHSHTSGEDVCEDCCDVCNGNMPVWRY